MTSSSGLCRAAAVRHGEQRVVLGPLWADCALVGAVSRVHCIVTLCIQRTCTWCVCTHARIAIADCCLNAHETVDSYVPLGTTLLSTSHRTARREHVETCKGDPNQAGFRGQEPTHASLKLKSWIVTPPSTMILLCMAWHGMMICAHLNQDVVRQWFRNFTTCCLLPYAHECWLSNGPGHVVQASK